MPKSDAEKQNMTFVVKKDTRRLLGIIAAMHGKTPSEFVAELADAAVESYLTPEEQERFLQQPESVSEKMFPKEVTLPHREKKVASGRK